MKKKELKKENKRLKAKVECLEKELNSKKFKELTTENFKFANKCKTLLAANTLSFLMLKVPKFPSGGVLPTEQEMEIERLKEENGRLNKELKIKEKNDANITARFLNTKRQRLNLTDVGQLSIFNNINTVLAYIKRFQR
jgi:hypothetical protein